MRSTPHSVPRWLPQFDGVIFDLDGTLLDTVADIGNAANSVLAQHGFPVHPLPAYRGYVGDGVRVLMTRALPPESRDEKTLDACLKTMAVEYPRHLNKAACPYPGIPELLSTLRQNELRLAVLSNKPDEFTTRCVVEFFGDGVFDPILGLSASRPRKPDPAGALAICEVWQVVPARVLYLGDGDTDMKTARSAGMFAVGALWGYRSEADLRASGAQMLVKSPAELLSTTL